MKKNIYGRTSIYSTVVQLQWDLAVHSTGNKSKEWLYGATADHFTCSD